MGLLDPLLEGLTLFLGGSSSESEGRVLLRREEVRREEEDRELMMTAEKENTLRVLTDHLCTALVVSLPRLDLDLELTPDMS